MNILTLMFGVVLCFVVINARHFERTEEGEGASDENDDYRKRDHGITQNRHRRRRWQSNFGYDIPHFYPDRRDYDRNNQEALQQIFRLLEDISAHIRRPPPPPPQPIYIPYPVPYPVPQYVKCTPKDVTPNITERFPAMEDTNQNWGFVSDNNANEDDGLDGSRPISFEPIKPKQTMTRPAPKVEHGTVLTNQITTRAPSFDSVDSGVPGMCNAAILSCCGLNNNAAQQRQCFSNVGCSDTYESGDACSEQSISKALDSFRVAYSPVQ